MFERRMDKLRQRLAEGGVGAAVITDDDNVYYLTGYYDYLHMEFGRPTILVVPRDGKTLLITPSIDAAAAKSAAQVDRISTWNDGAGNEWREKLPVALGKASTIAIESDRMPPPVRAYIDDLVPLERISDVSPLLAEMRMIKSPEELQLARHAGEVAGAMMAAGRAAIGDRVPEFEVALATSQAGTRKAAELLKAHNDDADMSANTRFLQIMAS